MSITLTYFVHGTTTDNEVGNRSGWNDVELSELGVKQAKELTLQTKGKIFDIVFCSDLKRAVDSANHGFKEYPLQIDDRLREVNYGDLTAVHETKFPNSDEFYIHHSFPNGESFLDVQNRISSFLRDLHANFHGKEVAVVAHRAPQLALDVLINGKTWEQAFREDWRIEKKWQPGWEYIID